MKKMSFKKNLSWDFSCILAHNKETFEASFILQGPGLRFLFAFSVCCRDKRPACTLEQPVRVLSIEN